MKKTFQELLNGDDSLIKNEDKFTLDDIFGGSNDYEPWVGSYYDILENDAKDLLFVLPYSGEACSVAPQDAKMFYDGGKHAVLKGEAIPLMICDHINSAVRKNLSSKKEILVCFCPKGTDLQNGRPETFSEFMAEVVYLPNLPISEKLQAFVDTKDD